MRTKIQRWGHSPALRIPKPFAIEAKLVDRTEVDLIITNGKLVVTPAAQTTQSLKDLLSRVKIGTCMRKWIWGLPWRGRRGNQPPVTPVNGGTPPLGG